MKRSLTTILLFATLTAVCARAAEDVSLYPIQTIAGGPGGGGDVGQYSRLAHDPDGGQHVVYYDATYGDLKYAHRRGNGYAWTIEAVDTDGDVGRWCSLAVGAALETTGQANVTNGSRTVEITTGTTPTSVVIGGKFRLEPGGAWLAIAGVDAEQRHIELETPFSGPTTPGAPFRIRYYQPTISYQGRASYGSTLRLARPGEAGAWTIADIDPQTTSTTTSITGYETSLALDSAGGIHIAYQDRSTTESSTGQLRCAEYDGADWTFTSPLPTEAVAGAARIRVDSADGVWVFCRSNTDNALLALQREAGGWVRTILETGGRPGMALDAVYVPASDMFYLSSETENTSTTTLNLTTSSNVEAMRAWNTGPILTMTNPAGSYTSVASGTTSDSQRLVYYDANRQLMAVEAAAIGEPASPVVLDGGVDVGRYCSAQLGPTDEALYVSYYDARGTALKLARKEQGKDATNGYVDGIKAGTYSDVGFTATEAIVAYYNATEGNLHVARWPRSGVPADGSDVVVDATSTNVGEYVSMAVDPDGRIFLVYYDRAYRQLRMATWDNVQWNTTAIAGYLQHIGEYCRIAIDASGKKLGIAWRDADQLALCYAIVDIPTDLNTMNMYMIEPQTIGAGEEVGRYLSVAWGDFDGFHMAYYSDKKMAPMYSAVGTSGTTDVITETIESSTYNVSGWFTSITYGPSGQPLVAFQDVTHGSLKFAERTGDNTWAVTTIADNGDTGFYPVLRYDKVYGEIYVVYYNQSAGTLMLRSKPVGETAWRSQVTLAIGTRGIHPALSIDSSGLLYLTFYHQSAGDLLYMNPSYPPIMNAAAGWRGYR